MKNYKEGNSNDTNCLRHYNTGIYDFVLRISDSENEKRKEIIFFYDSNDSDCYRTYVDMYCTKDL
ncbi:MAG: hypothetical protein K5662_09385, partial [Lachnospiraceae bacterium]|nr:hypothetical protein [Lachnospiraceae bacterium]